MDEKIKEIDGWWKTEFQYLLDRKILSRDELSYLFSQIKSIIEQEEMILLSRIKELEVEIAKLLLDKVDLKIYKPEELIEEDDENR